MKLSVIIPVFNERTHIEEVLERVLAVNIPKEVVIVNDGSSDGTTQILEKYEDGNSVRVYNSASNCGKGAAIRLGLKHITGDIVIIQDADLEYDPQDYYNLIKPIEEGRAAVVFGSRFLGKIENMEFRFWLANKIVTAVANLFHRANITDAATCYKVFRTDVIKGIKLCCDKFDFCAEVTAKVRNRGYQILEVPISYKARTRVEGKKVGIMDAWRHFWGLIKYKFVD